MSATFLGSAWMSDDGSNGFSTFDFVGNKDTTGATLLIAAASYYDSGSNPITLSDNKGCTWLPLTAGAVTSLDGGWGAATAMRARIYYANPVGAQVGTGHTFKLAPTGGTGGNSVFASLTVLFFSGITVATTPLESGATSTGTTSLQPGSAAPNAGDLAIEMMSADYRITGPPTAAGLSVVTTQDANGVTAGYGFCYQNLVAYGIVGTTPINPLVSWTNTVGVVVRLATFSPVSGGGGGGGGLDPNPLYVSTSGVDGAGHTGAIGDPWRTFNYAATRIGPGNTLYARGSPTVTGIYDEIIEGVNFPNGTDFFAGSGAIAVKAYPGETVWVKPSSCAWAMRLINKVNHIWEGIGFDGTGSFDGSVGGGLVSLNGNTRVRLKSLTIYNADWSGILMSDSAGLSQYCELQQLTITLGGRIGAAQSAAHGIYLSGTAGTEGLDHHTLVEGCDISGYNALSYDSAIQVSHSGTIDTCCGYTIRNNKLHNCGIGAFLDMSNTIPTLFYNNSVYANAAGGVLLYEDSKALIYNNTIHGNNGWGVDIGAGYHVVDGAVVINNSISNNSQGPVIVRNTLPNHKATIAYNNCNGNGNGNNILDQNGLSGISNTTVASPGYTNAGVDFSLTSASALRDIGLTIAAVSTDQIGTVRPFGSGYDIGAFEYFVASGSTTLATPRGQLIFAGKIPVVLRSNSPSPPTGALKFAGRIPTIQTGAPSVLTGALEFTGYPPVPRVFLGLSNGLTTDGTPIPIIKGLLEFGYDQLGVTGLDKWSPVYDWLATPGIRWRRGLPGINPQDVVAEPGTMTFTLNNSSNNRAGLQGRYSPGHVNWLPAFTLNLPVKFSIDNVYRFTGFITAITPRSGIHNEQIVEVEVSDWMELAQRVRLDGLPIQVNKRADETFQVLIDSLVSNLKPLAVEKDTGDVFPYALDRTRDEQTMLRDEIYRLAISSLDKVWMRGNGTVVYESRTRRAVTSTPKDTFTDTHGVIALQDFSGIINWAQCTVHPRTPDNNFVVLWSLDTPMSLGLNVANVIIGPFTDPTNQDTRVGAWQLSPLQISATLNPDGTINTQTIDYLANTLADGTGTDLTSFLVITTVASGNAVEFTVTLTGTTPGILTKLQQRGKAIHDYAEAALKAEDAASIALYGLIPTSIDMPYQANPLFGQEAAQYLVYTQASPKTQVSGMLRVSGLFNTSVTDLHRSLDREISDLISLTETMTGVNSRFYIQAIEEELVENTLKTAFLLQPIATTSNFWLLGVTGYSELGTTTKLGFGFFGVAAQPPFGIL